MFNTKKRKKDVGDMHHLAGVSLVEVLIGIFLFSIVFFGIFGVVQLAARMSSGEQNKVAATAVANGEMEKIKNLSYELIGTVGGFPSGVLEPVKNETVSNRIYVVETKIDYVIDPKDGIAEPDDDCINDYKKVQVKVSWSEPFNGSIVVVSDIVASNLSQECGETGGILYISVFNSFGEMVPLPLIEVKNIDTDETIKSVTPDSGQHYFSLPIDAYKIVVSKDGYNTERTYGIDEIASPVKPNPQVLENKVTEISFSIDRVGALSVHTLSPWVISDFSDSFNDQSKLSGSFNVSVADGKIMLSKEEGDYLSSGYATSASIAPSSLIGWSELGWQDEISSDTFTKYRIFYKPGSNWILAPDSDLPGNSLGFDKSPIDLSGLNINSYPEIRIRVDLSTNNSQSTPIVNSWFVTWKSSGGIPISNVVFNMSGNKIIGKDGDENLVYKHSQDYNSGISGSINISNLEWDEYTFFLRSSALNLESIEPAPQPISLPPDGSVSVNLFLEAQDSLFITTKDVETEEPIFSASIRIYNAQYDFTKYTDIKGQTYFAPLPIGNYTIETQAQGYLSDSRAIFISGETIQMIQLLQDD